MCVGDAPAYTVAVMNGFGTRVDDTLVPMDGVMHELQANRAALVRTGPRAACEELINLSVADFPAASVGTPASSRSLYCCR